jgi:hypothetical protein
MQVVGEISGGREEQESSATELRPVRRSPDRREIGSKPRRSDDVTSPSNVVSPSVNDLIEAYQEPGRPDYLQIKADYERCNGKVVEDYFGRFVHAGALLIENSRTGFFCQLRRRRFRIALAYDCSRTVPELDETLRTVRREERQSAILLSGRAGQILAQTAYLLIVYLLNAVDRSNAQGAEYAVDHVASVVSSARRDLRKMEQFTRLSARRSALQYYLTGLPAGAIVGILLVVCVFESQTVGRIADNSLLSFCLASGAIGAVISVMVRINRGTTLEVDFDRGRVVTVLAGSFRPIIGAVFGGALYVLVQAGLLPLQVPAADAIANGVTNRDSFFFLGLAFLAGFSERWAQDTIVNSAPKFPAARSTETPPDHYGQTENDPRSGLGRI